MLRSVVAILAGLVSSMATVWLIQWLGHRQFPRPAGTNLRDPEQMQAFIQNLPPGALAMSLAAWTAGTLVGGLVACRVARERPMLFAGLIGGVMIAAAAVNLTAIAHPTGFAYLAIGGVIGASLLAARIASTTGMRRRSF